MTRRMALSTAATNVTDSFKLNRTVNILYSLKSIQTLNMNEGGFSYPAPNIGEGLGDKPVGVRACTYNLVRVLETYS